MTMAMAMASSKSYGIYQKMCVREKFRISDVKHGRNNNVVRFEKRGDALLMKDVLNIAIARFGTWEDAIELRGDDLVVSESLRDFGSDAADFEYVDVESYDDGDTNYVKISVK
jgi:hypothetical protein